MIAPIRPSFVDSLLTQCPFPSPPPRSECSEHTMGPQKRINETGINPCNFLFAPSLPACHVMPLAGPGG